MSTIHRGSPRRRRGVSTKFTLAACAFLTALHLGAWVAARGAAGGAVAVSELEPGAILPADLLDRLGPLPPGACHVLVSLDPLCPVCKRAAEREGVTARAGWAGDVVWVARETSDDLAQFEQILSERSTALATAPLYEALEVRGVPGLYIVGGEGEVRWVGPYRGSETETQLAERCSGERER
jgi:hypothetical protein